MNAQPHWQFDTRHTLVYAGLWLQRWGFGFIFNIDDDGYGWSASLLIGPAYIGIGWQA